MITAGHIKDKAFEPQLKPGFWMDCGSNGWMMEVSPHERRPTRRMVNTRPRGMVYLRPQLTASIGTGKGVATQQVDCVIFVRSTKCEVFGSPCRRGVDGGNAVYRASRFDDPVVDLLHRRTNEECKDHPQPLNFTPLGFS